MKCNSTKLAVLVITALLPLSTVGKAEDSSASARQEIEEAFGTLPSYFQVYPEAALGAGWALMKGTDFNGAMVLDPKVKELIALGVAAQIPCRYCVYYHRRAAAAQGATEEELKEAVLAASIVRHWSTILQGADFDYEAFKAETDSIFPAD